MQNIFPLFPFLGTVLYIGISSHQVFYFDCEWFVGKYLEMNYKWRKMKNGNQSIHSSFVSLFDRNINFKNAFVVKYFSEILEIVFFNYIYLISYFNNFVLLKPNIFQRNVFFGEKKFFLILLEFFATRERCHLASVLLSRIKQSIMSFYLFFLFSLFVFLYFSFLPIFFVYYVFVALGPILLKIFGRHKKSATKLNINSIINCWKSSSWF